jgi:poly-gamma-glutamate synthesis protein (capsule biosynthesis protein)
MRRFFIIIALAVSVNAATISFVGDVTIASPLNRTLFDDAVSENSYAYFLSEVKGIFSKCDMNVANLETVISDSGNPVPKRFNFRGKPQYLEILKSGGIQTVSIANNHIFDYDSIGYRNTEMNLNTYGINYYGFEKTFITYIDGIKIGFIADKGFLYNDTLIQKIKAFKDSVDVLVVSMHWGVELARKPCSTQVQIAHEIIDAGADLIIGHHPHVLQPIEKYNGKYIAYSLGNFCFGGNANPRDKSSIILLAHIEKSGINIEAVPVRISSRIDTNNYRPVVVTGKEATGVFSKLKFKK